MEQLTTRETVMQKLTGLPPEGLAEVARFIDFLEFRSRPRRSAAATRKRAHPAFGIWADHSEIKDPVEFTQVLRHRIETRQDG